MCFGGDVYNTTINVNGRNVFSSRYSPCCCRMPYMNSCWGMGYGYGGFGCFWPGSFESGLGMGVGFGAGMMLTNIFANLINRRA